MLVKKNVALILSALIMASFCACHDSAEESSDDTKSTTVLESTVIGDASDEESSGEESLPDPFVESEDVEKINSYVSHEIDRTTKAKNIFSKRKYTYSVVPDQAYADDAYAKLTDGIVMDVFDKYNWVAFNGGSNVEIVFDMENNDHRLATIEVDVLNQVSYGIKLPASVVLSVSNDGENYTEISSIASPSDVPQSGKYVYRFSLPKATSARYIKIKAIKASSGFFFVDEVFGYEYSPDGDIDIERGEIAAAKEGTFDFYDYHLNTGVGGEVSKNDADYDTFQNLARISGVDVQIKHFDPMNDGVAASNTPIGSASMLFDGKKASSAQYGDSSWFKFVRGYGRHVDMDLGNVMSVSNVKAEFLNQISVGIATPPAVNISLSVDGENWFLVYGDTTIPYGDRNNSCIYALDASFEKEYKARYVRITFATVPQNAVSSMVYLSEIEVWGRKNTSSASDISADTNQPMGSYPDPEKLGVKAIMLSALGNIGAANGAGPMSEAMAIKYYGKHSDDGSITDTFFDSYCFAPANAFAKSGDPKEDGKSFIDEIFTDGYNLSELDKAVKYVNEKLGRSDKATYWINLSCMGEKAVSADELYDVLKYQADYALEKEKAAGFENLRLVGFYYNDECLFQKNEDITVEALSRLNKYLHENGLMSLWCPYYNAYGIWRWRDAGFDIACLQPNYMFYSTESTRLTTCAETAKLYGMCVEMELEDVRNQEACALYREYIRAGIDSGYMNSVQMYYEGAVGGAICSSYGMADEHSAAVYEDTYKYVRGTLDKSYDLPDSADLSSFPENIELEVKNGKSVDFDIGDVSGLSCRYVQSPLYGRICLNVSGKGSYRAMKGYRGKDVVCIEISDPTGNRRVITVTIDITE